MEVHAIGDISIQVAGGHGVNRHLATENNLMRLIYIYIYMEHPQERSVCNTPFGKGGVNELVGTVRTCR